MSDVTRSRFDELRKVVHSHFNDYLVVGFALLEISKEKLYLQEYKTFEEFCQKEFEIPRRQAYKMIEAASVVQDVPELAHAKASHIAEIAKIDPKKRKEVVDQAQKDGATTAKGIRKAAEELHDDDKEYDEIGRQIPPEILEDWHKAENFSEVLSLVSRVKVEVERLFKEEDVITAEIHNGTLAEIKHVYTALKQVLPYSLCPTCNGLGRKKCVLCKGRGWISKMLYESAIPAETKKVIEKMGAKNK
jgi:hypothetical protein